jgi:hypothetical protein
MRMQCNWNKTSRSAEYAGMGMCKPVKGANTHHDKGTECESENVKSLNMYTDRYESFSK